MVVNSFSPVPDVDVHQLRLYQTQIEIDKIISKWSPYKSLACRVLWQWVDKGMPEF